MFKLDANECYFMTAYFNDLTKWINGKDKYNRYKYTGEKNPLEF